MQWKPGATCIKRQLCHVTRKCALAAKPSFETSLVEPVDMHSWI